MADTNYQQLSRILFLIPQLSKKNGHPITKICKEFNITRKQLIKDIELISMATYGDFHDRDLIDIYIEKNRLYFYSGDLFKRPLRLNYGETLALNIGLNIVAQQGLIPRQQSLFNIQEKLSQLTIGTNVERNAKQYVFEDTDASSNALVQKLIHAIENKCPVQLKYFTVSRNQFSEKILHSYCLVCHNGEWYLIAFCPEIGESRRYKVDRMSDVKSLKGSYKIPKDFQLENNISSNMFINYKKLPKVTVEFTSDVARWVEEMNPKGKKQKTGSYIVEMKTNSLEWLFSILLKYGNYAKILKPLKVRDTYKELIDKMLWMYTYYGEH